MVRLIITFISVICLVFSGWVYCYADEIVGSNVEDKVKIIELYMGDQTGYPYEVIEEITVEGLRSSQARMTLLSSACTSRPLKRPHRRQASCIPFPDSTHAD